MPFTVASGKPYIHYSIIYILSVIFAFHNVLVIFTNSSYIEKYVDPTAVGTLYTVGSAIAVLVFLFISRILRILGNVVLTLTLAVLEITALLLLGLSTNPGLVIVAFVLFLIINPLLFLNLDIFSETLIGDDEETTGFKRGLILTLISAAAVIAPLTIGPIVGDSGNDNLHRVYLVSAAVFSLFFLAVVARLRQFPDPPYSTVRVRDALYSFWQNNNIRYALLAQYVLQLNFSWLVIYAPLYLSSVVGFSWSAIGTMLAIGTLAYVLFEFPVGYIADRYIGEQEMMILGFIIMAITSASMSLITSGSLFAWIAIMFVVRIGASLVEATVESFFFKHTKGNDTYFLSFFRLTRPLAIMSGGLLGSASLLFLSFQYIFIVLGLVTLIGVFFASKLVDTK